MAQLNGTITVDSFDAMLDLCDLLPSSTPVRFTGAACRRGRGAARFEAVAAAVTAADASYLELDGEWVDFATVDGVFTLGGEA